MLFPQRRDELLVGDVGGVVLVHVDLFENHATLVVDLVLSEGRPLNHLAEDLDAEIQVRIAKPRPITRVLLRRERVVACADGIERFADAPRRPVVRALEEEVLEEVTRPGLNRCLVAAPRVDPCPDRERSQRGHVLGDDPQPVRQRREVVVHIER